ncbi:hypothetical protein SAMN04487950_4600 [Halogranum rubrum]|uniref:Uncharacterized protein n=1 Tax=Halogranum rubrum TaxID=553466 RepID=A0A1I4JQY4_9EURY|nr:hypothetical protein [Halogranum rubrum]SFL68526.1 hypothetical protein SAMN04487950_4600 [Halogranum rubrum]
MMQFQNTLQSLIPIAMTFVLVLAYQSVISTVLSGVPAFGVTVVLSIATWYVICRVVFDSDGRLSAVKRLS